MGIRHARHIEADRRLIGQFPPSRVEHLVRRGRALEPHPVRRRPTLCGAGQVQGAKVERPTGRTTLASWTWSARLCLGRRWTG